MMIPLFKVLMSPDAPREARKVLMSGYIGQGSKVEEFERALSEYLDHPAPLTVNSGTSALTLALRMIKDQARNDGEVLTQAITCTATNWPILAMGQRIRWVDTNPRDGIMDMADLRRNISSKTVAIMLVHWGGYPNDLDAVRRVQDECQERYGHRPAVIEDAAHAFGSRYRGKKIGNHGNFTAFSFQAIKTLTTGDGGALLCPHENLSHEAKMLRWYGIDRTLSDNFRCEQDIVRWGYKFHMNDINASIGLANFEVAVNSVQKHRDNAAFYRRELRGINGITLLEETSDRESSYWLFTVRCGNRDDLAKRLNEKGIAAGRVHERNDGYTCTKDFRSRTLPGTDIMHREMLCIPVGWWVRQEEREYIVDTIRQGW